ncbi:MAG TPA: gamma-glutamyl-gamma-aminobutyrate hydrolase family protein [Solirubrobacteraceae bacterium]|jgi:putative glutamine amidotransferase|nr:gamma-glutamyl-gamma-aminobutyrate hydrolase family protein [Solirubrobacteraceae bacterium]
MGLAYARPLEAAGALPLQLPYLADPAALLGVADGVLLGFGADIDPARYGGSPHPSMTEHSRLRDAFELELARLALAEGLPVLGICRGMQLLNVVQGGTLLADAAPHPGGDWERWALVRAAVLSGEPPPEHPGHALRVQPGTRLAAALGAGATWVNSYHHQAVERLGQGIEPVAWAEDGLVEALELQGDAWVLGVQWELQESWKDDARMLSVFEQFAAAARGERARPRGPRAAA